MRGLFDSSTNYDNHGKHDERNENRSHFDQSHHGDRINTNNDNNKKEIIDIGLCFIYLIIFLFCFFVLLYCYFCFLS